jgi:hypothetical protein
MNFADEVYLGDGLYVCFRHGAVQLRAPCDASDEIIRDRVVYMEPRVLDAFLEWLNQLRANERVAA